MQKPSLLEVIKRALARCGIEHDDVEWMAYVIHRAIADVFRVVPREEVPNNDSETQP